MRPGVLLLSAALLLILAAVGLLWGQRTERRRGRAAGAFVDQRLEASATRGAGAQGGRLRARGNENGNGANINARGTQQRSKRSLLTQLADRPFESLPAVENIFVRAGVVAHSKWLLWHGGAGLIFALIAALFAGWVPALLVVLLAVVFSCFELWLKVSKRNKLMVRQLPGFLDGLVRQVTVGTSLGSAFQQIAPQTPEPLGEVLGRAAQLSRAGIDLDVAVKQTARIYDLTPLLMIGAVLGVSTRFGGRSDQVLERISGFLRDMESAQDELRALTSETRMSAWVLGALPFAVASFLIIFNNSFFMQMWNDPVGKKMLLGAVCLQMLGSFLLYKLAKSL